MAATVATGEGNFDMKMQDFWALKSLNFSGPRPLAEFRPSNPKIWIRACLQ